MKKLLLILLFLLFQNPASDSFIRDEGAYRLNNLGVALLEQYKYREAAEKFNEALKIKPDLAMAQINLAIAQFNLQDLGTARKETLKALRLSPEMPQGFYLLGLIEKGENKVDEALGNFQRVLETDPKDVGTNVNLGQILSQKNQYAEARSYFQTAFETEPYNITAIYNLALISQRLGNRPEAQRLLKEFQTLRQNGAGTVIGQNYLEQGHYAEAVYSTGAETELVDRHRPRVVFLPQNNRINLGEKPSRNFSDTVFFGRSVSDDFSDLKTGLSQTGIFFDSDNDGKPELFLANYEFQRLLRPDQKSNYQPLDAGDLNKTGKTGRFAAVAGDYDNDGLTDIFVLEENQPRLYRNTGGDKFVDVTKSAKIPAYPFLSISCAFSDVDHDGDLDIFIAGLVELTRPEKKADPVFPTDFPPAPNLLLRNNGDGTFSDITAEAGVLSPETRSVAVIPTDFDNRRDIDLLLVNYGLKPDLFRNLRDTTFTDVAAESGLKAEGNWTCAAAGDFNKDNFVDFFFGQIGKPGVFVQSDGKGKFSYKSAPEKTAGATAAQFLDYDDDGLLDLLINGENGPLVWRNLGDRWENEPEAVKFPKTLIESIKNSRFLLSSDPDFDGDLDLITGKTDDFPQFILNQNRQKNHSLLFDLKGLASNKNAVGAKIDLRSGSLTQKLETYSASPMPAPSVIHFGLGKRKTPDAVRIIWPSGIVQAETDFQTPARTGLIRPKTIEELDRKPSSCPYLYSWDGGKFAFITDFLGGGEMGNWAEKGVYHQPDPDEFVRIPPDLLKPLDGFYQLRVTNELEEVLYLDRLELIAVEHERETSVFPNEGLGISNPDKRIIYTARNSHPPLSARDGFGNDILEKISGLDRKFYDTFPSQKIRGYAEEHSLEMELDDKKGFRGRTLLFLTGWTDYAFSSDNLAASQSGKSLFFPKLQVKNKNGEWQTVIDSIGISIGRPQTVVVDLTGKFLTDSRRVRIVTNFKTFWDQIAVDTSEDDSGNLKTKSLLPTESFLRERGFSREVQVSGNSMIVPDYKKVEQFPKWKLFRGSYTRTGDVGPLLKDSDDIFVISKTGDELVLKFPVLPDPPKGREYTFFLFASGYSKEMDINSGSPDVVFPLPFRQMTEYPYDETREHYPMTEERLDLFEKYNTRKVQGTFPFLAGPSD
ncbi:MAG: FG-GAP-like repeat-containing protein [Pyrinomonadaceae bacterium]